MANASTDDNSKPTLIGVSSSDGTTPIKVYVDPVTHRLLVDIAGAGGTGTNYTVSGTIDGSNVTFTIPVAVTSDFSLFLARQPQAPTTDYTYVAGASTTTITMTYAPDSALSGQPFWAFVIS